MNADAVAALRAALKDEVRGLAFLTREDWSGRRGADPIARTINAVFDIIDVFPFTARPPEPERPHDPIFWADCAEGRCPHTAALAADPLPSEPLTERRRTGYDGNWCSCGCPNAQATPLPSDTPADPEVLASAYQMALRQIEHDGEVINRLERALTVAAHKPHDQNGEPNEGFPTCSVCGAIQTDHGPNDLRAALEGLVRQYHALGVNTDERAHRLVHRPGSHINCDDHFCRWATAALALTREAPTDER